MTCTEFEILLCDYMDGTLDAAQRAELESHRESCAACSELARDVSGALGFMERIAEVEVPPELLTRLTFQIPTGKSRPPERREGLLSSLRRFFQPVLQPRFAMGMAMTILSFSLIGRFAGIEVKQLKPSDLAPTAIWTAADDRLHKSWQRVVKYYEGLKVVYEVQSRLKEWTEQDEDRTQGTQAQPGAAKPAGGGAQTAPPVNQGNKGRGEQ